jgi:endogenous inhibitor of DNA gyrase (YacG/DUF329 family)
MSSPTTSKCPTCKTEVQAPPENRFFPFCTQRCRTIDLGKWLNEEYRLVNDTAEDEEDGSADA